MKKSIRKIMLVAFSALLAVNFAACTVKNGSVIKTVKFSVSYSDTDNKSVNKNGIMELYETFAPKTSAAVLDLVKGGKYKNTDLVFSRNGKYVVFGALNKNGNDYEKVNLSSKTIDGEFTKAGWESKLSADKGTLVMLRDYDSDEGGKKYDSAKGVFAVILESGDFTKGEYTVFGKVDDATVTFLTAMRDKLYKNDKDKVCVKYVGKDCNELKYGGIYYYSGNTFYRNAEDEEGITGELSEELSNANSFDFYALPVNPVKLTQISKK